MKKFLCIILFVFLLCPLFCDEHDAVNFDADDFFSKPFTDKDFPSFFDDYDSFLEYYKDYSLKEKEVKNKYNNDLDKEITVKNDNEGLLYYFRSYDGMLVKLETFIYNFENIKYNFNKSMMVFDIAEICGEDYFIKNFDNIIDLYYDVDTNITSGRIHFLLDKKTKLLKAITLIPER